MSYKSSWDFFFFILAAQSWYVWWYDAAVYLKKKPLWARFLLTSNLTHQLIYCWGTVGLGSLTVLSSAYLLLGDRGPRLTVLSPAYLKVVLARQSYFWATAWIWAKYINNQMESVLVQDGFSCAEEHIDMFPTLLRWQYYIQQSCRE